MPAQILDRPGPSYAERVAALSPKQRDEWIAQIPEDQIARALHDWRWWGRPAQILPTPAELTSIGYVLTWYTWLILSGRGFGKTRTGAETVHEWAKRYPRIAILGPSAGDVRDTMIEGEAGILATGHPSARPQYEPSKRRLTWPNGAIATTFGAGEDPEELRGPQFYKAWLDELAAWRHAEEAVAMLDFGLRLGDDPQRIVTTTPKPRKAIKDLIKRPTTIITKGTSYDNIGNLSPVYINEVIRPYEGTRLGRQEIYAEILDDVPGAMWRREFFQYAQHPHLSAVAVAVDPSVTSTGHHCGIIAGARGDDNNAYILGDYSMQGSPLEWGKRSIHAYLDHHADHIVYETNQGGELVRQNLELAAYAIGVPTPKLVPVHASRGKRTRAEPVANLYEQRRVFHITEFEDLEEQLVTWTPEDDSPDRLDANVWLLTDLMLDRPQAPDADYLAALQNMKVHE